MPSSQPEQRFLGIIDNIDWISSDIQDMSIDQFIADRKTQDAVLFCVLRISEAAKKLGDLGEAMIPNQEWHAIRSIGNYLRHEYDFVDNHQIWKTITEDLPQLRFDCENALSQIRLKPNDGKQ